MLEIKKNNVGTITPQNFKSIKKKSGKIIKIMMVLLVKQYNKYISENIMKNIRLRD